MKKHKIPKSAITEKELRDLMKKEIKSHSSMSEWSKEVGVTPQSVSAFFRKTQGAGLKIPKLLGYKPQTVYIPVDADPISTAMPPRRATANPTSKTDSSRDPIESRGRKSKLIDREEVRKKLKKRKQGK